MRSLMIFAASAALAGLAMASPTAAAPKLNKGETVMFNPQPDPPGFTSKPRVDFRGRPLANDELNPQPLPPNPPDRRLKAKGGRFGSVELNPQPEPPGRR